MPNFVKQWLAIKENKHITKDGNVTITCEVVQHNADVNDKHAGVNDKHAGVNDKHADVSDKHITTTEPHYQVQVRSKSTTNQLENYEVNYVFYPNYRLKSELCSFSAGNFNGVGRQRHWFTSGQLMSMATLNPHQTGVRQGEYVAYLADGTLLQQGCYHNDKREGEWYEFNAATGLGYTKTNYLNGKKDGNEQQFTIDGTLIADGSYDDGVKSGSWWFYDPSSQLVESGQMCDDYKQLDWTTYDRLSNKPVLVTYYDYGEVEGEEYVLVTAKDASTD